MDTQAWGRVGADQARPAGGRLGQQVAADIACRQSQAAQAADHHVRKIPAHALAQRQRFERGRAHVGRFGLVGKVFMDARGQLRADSTSGRSVLKLARA